MLSGIIKNIDTYELFVIGVKKGIKDSISIVPVIIGIMVSIYIFKASGLLNALVSVIKPIANIFNIPEEIIPLAIIRPLSGSSSLALVSEQIKEYGPDSYIGRVLSVIMGSTETLFYTVAIYLGASNIKKTGCIIPVSIISQIIGIIAALWICKIL